MARIRSTHPGQWKDGDFLECSPLARLLALALRNIADDHGIFRWKPTTLKAECLPADNCDVLALLGELILFNQVTKYTAEGKEYGLIRDFTQWQRPKKPHYVHPIPDGFATGTEPVPNQTYTASEIPPQRKEEGGSKREESGASDLRIEFCKAIRVDRDEPSWIDAHYWLDHLLSRGFSRELILSTATKVMAGRHKPPPRNYFEKAIETENLERSAPAKPEVSRAKSGGNVIEAADRQLQRFRELNAPAPSFPELPERFDRRICDGAGSIPVRAISQR